MVDDRKVFIYYGIYVKNISWDLCFGNLKAVWSLSVSTRCEHCAHQNQRMEQKYQQIFLRYE